jgi:opacity protein-like surface antigen
MTQSFDEPKFKRFGFKAGVNVSHINFARGHNSPALNIETTWGKGINIGFIVLVPLTDKLFFQPEYSYAQMGGEIKAAKTIYKLNYLSMPLLLKYQLVDHFSLLAGPQFDILLNAKKTVDGSAADITHDTEERSIGATAGVEYEISNSFAIGARYMQGLNHIGIGQRSDIQEFKYELAQLTACIKF